MKSSHTPVRLRARNTSSKRLTSRNLILETLECRRLLTTVDELLTTSNIEFEQWLAAQYASLPAPNVPEIETNPPVPGPVSLGSIEDYLDPWYPTFAGDDLYEDGMSMDGKSVFVGGGDANSSWTIGSNISILPEGIYPSIVGPVDLNSDSTILASDNGSGPFYGPNMFGGGSFSMVTPWGPGNPNPNPVGAVISLHIDMWAREGESPYFLVRTSFPLDRAVSVSLAYTASSSSGAIFGTDYTAPTSITLSPYTTSQMVTVRFLSDAITEGTEYFTVRITGLNVPASVATHETYAIGGTIIDVPPVGDPNSMVRIISIEDVIGTEGLNNSLTFRVTASNPKPNNPTLTIPFRTNDGTALRTQSPVADYSQVIGSITFAPTQTEAFITIPIQDDSVVESDEYFFVDLTLSGNARAGRSRGWGTIKDNDGPVNIFVSDAPPVQEGQTSLFRVRVDNPVRTITGTLRTFSGSAVQNQDYLGVDTPFTIPAGTREITIPVQTLVNNNPPESQIEHYFGRISSVIGASLGDSEGMATIEESSSPVTAYFWSPRREGDMSPNYLDVIFEIPRNFSQPVSITFRTEDRTAFAWSDYVPITPSQTITFIPGLNQPRTNTHFQAIVSIPTVPDLIQETPAHETFAFVIDSVSNGYLVNASQQTTMTIIADDNVPTLTVDGGTVYEGQFVPFVFKLNAMPPGGSATVTYQTQDGTAKDGIGESFDERDYIPVNPAGSITLTQLTTTISIESINDARVESDENFKLLVSAPSIRVATPVATGTILDNDSVIKLRIADATQIEGNQGYSPAELMKFSVSATVEGKQITNLIGVNLTTESVDQYINGLPNPKYATPITDFQPTGFTNGSFTFQIGQSRYFEVPIFGDLVPESNEEFRGRILSAGVIGTIPNGGQATVLIERDRALGTIIDDDILQAQELKFDFERVLDEEQNCICVASDGPDGALVSSKESALTISPDGILEYRKGGTHSTTQLQSFVVTRDPNTVIPNTYKTTVTVGGYTFTPIAFAGTPGDQDRKIAFSIPLDLKQFSTGFYEGEVKISATRGTQDAAGWQYTVKKKFQFRVVNNDNSEMPSDWWNPAVERLYPMKYFGQGNVSNPDWSKGAMYVRGDQTAWLFLGPNYAQPDGLISTLVRNVNGTFTLSDKFGGVKTFSNLGLLLSSADRNANTSTYSYIDANSDFFLGELSTIVDPLGRTTTYNYSGGKLIRVTDFAGRMTEYTVQNNKLTKITLPDPDLSGPRPAPYYDLSYNTAVASSWIQLIDADGALNKYTFDRFGKVTRVDDDYGGAWIYNYVKNRGIIVVLANGSSSGVAVMPGELEMTIINPRLNQTKIKTDRFGLPISVVYTDGSSESYTRNKHGSPLFRQYPSPSGGTNTTLYSYDTLQNPTSIADPSVGVISQSFGPHSLPTIINQTGNPTRYISRDSNGNPINVYTYSTDSVHGQAANVKNSLDSTSYLNNPIDRFDVNNDGFVNSSDITAINAYLASSATAFPGGVTSNGRAIYPDINGNGSVNSSDSLSLYMYLDSQSASPFLQDTYAYIGSASGVLNGTLATHTDPANQITSFEYYSTGVSRGLLKSISRNTPTGNAILATYDYDTFLNTKSVTDLYGVTTNYTYDRLDQLTQIDGAPSGSGTGPITSYQYSTMGHLTRITDPANQVTNIFRHANGQPFEITEQATAGGSNRTTTLTTDNMGNVLTVNEPGGIITEYLYDSRERVSEVKLPALNAITTHKINYTYNQAGYVTGIQDPFGSLTLITYAASGDQSIVKQIDPQNSANVSESKVFYSAPGLVSSTQSPTGDLSLYLRDGYSNLVAIDYPASNLGTYVSRPRVTFAYDSKMDQVAATDLNGQSQINRYDSLGRLTSIVTSDPDGIGPAGRSTTQFGAKTRSNGLHNQTVTLPDGRALTYTSDSRDRLTRIDMPSLNGTGTVFAAFQYDNLDRLTSERNFAGAFTEYVYNRFDEVTSVRGPNPVTGAADPNFATTFTYDDLGRNTSVTAPNGATTNFQYDPWNRITTMSEPDPDGINGSLARRSTTWTYNFSSNLRSVQQTSSDGESNTVTYDGLWRPITTVESGGGTTSYKYNPAGQITELKDPNNNITKWVYDSMGRVATEEQVGNASRHWKYTTPGQTREYTDRNGAKTEYQHNVSGQVSKELWTGTSTVFDYAYDARSRLTGITRSATDKVNWTYNTAGLVTSEVTTIPQVTSALGASSVTSTMNYAYDTAGRTTSKSLSNGSTVQYTDTTLYDFRDRMTQQSRTQSSGGSLWSKFTYNTLDLVTIAEQGTGSVTSNPELVQTTTRDLAGRPTSISYQSGANSLATYSMAYVSASNRLASLTTPHGTTNYGYSANGQLIQAGSSGYTYDANGNPTNRAGKTTQIGTWNRLLDDGDFTYQYDAEGRTTGRTSKTTGQTESYVWNRRGQLTQIDVHSNASLTNRTGQVNYSYDPTGRRTSVRNQTGIGSGSYAQSVDYLMSDGDQVGQILGATGQTTRRFRYGIGVDSVLSEQRFSGGTASNPEYQLTDHLGTVRGVAQRTTGVNAAVVNTLQYDSFGKLISQSNASKQPYHGFAGRDIEPVGGLTYNRNRYYSTQTGRFISQDPIGFNAGDENLYRYVGNSPTNATDPSGLAPPKKPHSPPPKPYIPAPVNDQPQQPWKRPQRNEEEERRAKEAHKEYKDMEVMTRGSAEQKEPNETIKDRMELERLNKMIQLRQEWDDEFGIDENGTPRHSEPIRQRIQEYNKKYQDWMEKHGTELQKLEFEKWKKDNNVTIKTKNSLISRVSTAIDNQKRNSNSKTRRGAARGEALIAVLGTMGMGEIIRRQPLVEEYTRKFAERGPYQMFLPDDDYEWKVRFDERANPGNPDRMYADGCTLSGRIVKPQP